MRYYTTQRIKGGTQFTCARCSYNVCTLDFDLQDGNLRTQAAHALNSHATQVHNQPVIISDPTSRSSSAKPEPASSRP